MNIKKEFFSDIINKEIISSIEYVINNSNLFCEEDLRFIRNYIIEHEPELRYNYPIVPYNLCEDKIMVIADTHLGNINDNIECINWAYEEALKKQVRKVLIAGDVFEGILPCRLDTIKLNEIKGKYANNNYYLFLLDLAKKIPNIDGIETKILLGNHDLSLIYGNMISTKDFTYIYNLIPNSELLGIGKVYINWTGLSNKVNCKFILNHEANLTFANHNFGKEDFIISGHHHYYKIYNNEVYVPTLSNDRTDRPGFLIFTLSKKGLIVNESNEQEKILKF